MANYGLPYQGSKDKLVDKLNAIIPHAENFYDLFGGGFSVSHFMLAHRKCRVHYNEIEQSTVKLVEDAIAGRYSYNTFKPEWVSREMFDSRKATCAYTRIVWSFGNNQKNYIFGKDIEAYKRSLHNAVVFDEFDSLAIDVLGMKSFPTSLSIRGRRLLCCKITREKFCKEKDDVQKRTLQQLQQLQQLERLEQLQQLEQLERLERLERLTTSSLSYDEVAIKPNSVVYCDPPYKGTTGYTRSFDHDRFWEWVRECPHPVYVSEYTAPPDIKTVAAFRHKKTNSQTTTDSVEKLFWNGKTPPPL